MGKVNRYVLIRLTIFLTLITTFLGWGWHISHSSSAEVAEILTNIYRQGNYIEAIIWFIFALGFLIVAWQNSNKISKQRFFASINFFLFGISDIVEVQTGAWWHPWWLLLWKSGCVFIMLWLLFIHLSTQQN
jgi:hypothetical protein